MTAQSPFLQVFLLHQWMFTGEHVIHFWLMGHKGKYVIGFLGFLPDKKRDAQGIVFFYSCLWMWYWKVMIEAVAANIWPWEETEFSPSTPILLSCWINPPWNNLLLDFMFCEMYKSLYLSISIYTPQNILTDIPYQLTLYVSFKRLAFMQLIY